MVLFSALFPPADVVSALRADLSGVEAPAELRWSEPDLWHVTLGFYGEDDPGPRGDWLAGRLAGRPAPTLRIQGAGAFSRVLYLGVYGDGLTELAVAAGAGQERPYLPHLTVARSRADVPAGLPRSLAGFASREWAATEVVLMRSDRTAEGPRYAVLRRFGLESGQAR
ncbi:MAG TPA: 2'-5' RNA ligase family protein [Amycolatopsis sp.]|nr:2'-5' RNA ligase family protein [Amycolatopsis sp.]